MTRVPKDAPRQVKPPREMRQGWIDSREGLTKVSATLSSESATLTSESARLTSELVMLSLRSSTGMFEVQLWSFRSYSFVLDQT